MDSEPSAARDVPIEASTGLNWKEIPAIQWPFSYRRSSLALALISGPHRPCWFYRVYIVPAFFPLPPFIFDSFLEGFAFYISKVNMFPGSNHIRSPSSPFFSHFFGLILYTRRSRFPMGFVRFCRIISGQRATPITEQISEWKIVPRVEKGNYRWRGDITRIPNLILAIFTFYFFVSFSLDIIYARWELGECIFLWIERIFDESLLTAVE